MYKNWKKFVFKRLLNKLKKYCIIQFNQSFYKQIDGFAIGSTLSVILGDIHIIRTEKEVVTPANPPFYKLFVDDMHSKRNKFRNYILFEALNDYHPNIKFNLVVNRKSF